MKARHPHPAGYSGTPLIRKLGIAPGARMYVHDAPRGFLESLGPLPDGARQTAERELDFAILFALSEAELRKAFTPLAARLAPAGMLWVAWPKKAAKVQTDLDFTVVQHLGLESGLVDTKICAVDETWSGLKFVRRLSDRPSSSRSHSR